MYLGSWKIDDYLTFSCNTHRADTGAASDADSVPTFRIYEDETGTAISTGSMALLDDAGTVGFYSERVQLTAGNGLEKGKCYTIYITATVNSVAGTMSHSLQIEAEVDANVVSDKTGYALSVAPPTAAEIQAEMEEDGASILDTLQDRITAAIPTVTQFEARTISPTAAGNMEDTWDGTGYIDDAAPATQAQVGRLSSGSAAIATNPLSSPDGFVIVTGTNEVNTEDATLELDGIVHSLEPDGGVTDCYYIFNVGGNGVPVSVLWYGFANSNLAEYVARAWNFGTSAWNQVETIVGTPGSSVIFVTFILANAHVGTGANIGEVRLGFYSTDGTKISTDRILCTHSVVFQSVGYANGAVWINTNISNENTQPYYDGIVERPVSTLAAAITIATNIGLKRFILLAGSSIILEQAYEGYQFYGSGSVINLNGQSVSGSRFYTTSITGDDNGTNPIPALFETCLLAGNLLGVHVLLRCALAGKITLGEEGDYLWDHCVSYVENIIPPVVDFNAGLNASNIHCHHYSGDIETENMGAGTGSYKMSIEGNGHLIINANCSATSTIAISGNMTREDNSGGAVTFVDDARFDVDQITDAVIDDDTKIDGSALNALSANDPGETLATTANQAIILAKVLAYFQLALRSDAAITTDNATELTEINTDEGSGGGDYGNQTESQEAILDTGNVDWITGAGGDATEANQAIILAKVLAYFQLALRSDAAINTDNATELTEINADEGSGAGDYDNQTESQEATLDTGNVDWITGSGLSGSNARTINIKDQGANNVVECAVEIWDSANTVFYERKATDASGNTTHNMDNGTYTVRIHKAGYIFTDKTLVISGAGTTDYTGTTITIGAPAADDACRVYEYCMQQDGITPMVNVKGTAQINTLPYDYSDSLHAGSIIDGTYDNSTGLLYWDLVRLASVKFLISSLGIDSIEPIPDADTARLTDL